MRCDATDSGDADDACTRNLLLCCFCCHTITLFALDGSIYVLYHTQSINLHYGRGAGELISEAHLYEWGIPRSDMVMICSIGISSYYPATTPTINKSSFASPICTPVIVQVITSIHLDTPTICICYKEALMVINIII